MSVNRVAELAGVSIGSLYQYFPTKEALVTEVAQRLSVTMRDAFSKDLPDLVPLTLEQAMRRIVENAFAAFRIDPALRRVIRYQVPEALGAFQTPDFDFALQSAIAAYLAQHRDRIRPADPELASRILMTAVEAIAESCGTDPNLDERAVVYETCELVAHYLLRETARKSCVT